MRDCNACGRPIDPYAETSPHAPWCPVHRPTWLAAGPFVVKVAKAQSPSRGRAPVVNIVMPTSVARAWPAWATHVELTMTPDGFTARVLHQPTDAHPGVELPWQPPAEAMPDA